MKRSTAALIVALVLGAALFTTLPLVMVMSVMSGPTESSSSCTAPSGGSVVVSAPAGHDLSARQLEIAGTVISVGRESGRSDRAIVIALAVASQESGFKNYANDGRGDDLAPEQRGIEASLRLPHDAVGTDHGSLGVFQQQWPWWGSMQELMDPATAAQKFYAALAKVPGWQAMGIGEAGQAVQRSAYPHAYDDDVPLAVSLLEGAGSADTVAQAAYYGSTADCAYTVFAGEVVMPLAGDNYVDAKSFGRSGSRWTTTHTGTDFSTPCGTSVLASTGGVITVRTDQAWSGRWLVTLDAGEGGVVTWYAHMQSVRVSTGDTVSPGQPIGEVGTEGNSTGCHLHFEVRPGGGDPIDPSAWLAANVGKALTVSDTTAQASAVIMTANLHHDLSDRAVADRLGELLRTGPDVLLLQEVQHRDLTAMAARAGAHWGIWHPRGARGHGAIIWDTRQFHASQKGNEFGVDVGRYERWMPWVILESQSGSLPIVNIHLPTGAAEDPQRADRFRKMTDRYLEMISQMNAAGLPPIVGGDWNHPLHEARRSWSPVAVLRKVGMTTNWQHGRPCLGTSGRDGRIDGFAYNPDHLALVDQGCLDREPSDHRPMWIAVRPEG